MRAGDHFTMYVNDVSQLIRDGRLEDAEKLLLELIDANEREAKSNGGVAPWYYEKLAIVYKKQKQHESELYILERYAAQPKAPGALPRQLALRLAKAKLIKQ